MAGTPGWANITRSLRNRPYRNYLAGRVAFLITSWMYRIAVGWMVWEMTQSASWLGVFGFLDQAPALLIMPFAGALADRINPLKVIRATQLALLALTLALSIVVALEVATIWVLAGFTLAYGVLTSMQVPATQTVLPLLVPRTEMVTAFGLHSVTFNVSRFIGPMLAGPLITSWGAAPAIFANTAGCALCVMTVVSLQARYEASTERVHPAHVLQDIRDGFAYAARHPGIAPTMTMLLVLALFPFSIDILLPSIADGVYGAGAHGLAWMTSMMGAGSICLALLVARRGGVAGLTSNVIRSILLLGCVFIGLALSPWFALALVWIFLIGFLSSGMRVSSMTLLQFSADPRMRGRAASFYTVLNQAGPALGSLGIGVLCDHLGVMPMMAALGVVTLGVWAWGYARRDTMSAALESEHKPAAAAPDAPRERAAE